MTNDEGVFIEFQRIGNQLKVTAIDPVTAREVSVIAPVSLSKEEASQLALRKLRYVLEKKP